MFNKNKLGVDQDKITYRGQYKLRIARGCILIKDMLLLVKTYFDFLIKNQDIIKVKHPPNLLP